MTTTFQLRFSLCYQEGPRKPGGTGTEWNASALVCTDDIINIWRKHICHKGRKVRSSLRGQ